MENSQFSSSLTSTMFSQYDMLNQDSIQDSFNGRSPPSTEMLKESSSQTRYEMEQRINDMMNEIHYPNLTIKNPTKKSAPDFNETDYEIPQDILDEMHREEKENIESKEEQYRVRFATLINEAKIKARDNATAYKNQIIKKVIDPICTHFEKHLNDRKDEIFERLVMNYQTEVYDIENDSWHDLRNDFRILVSTFTHKEFPEYGSYYLNLLISEISKRFRLKVIITESYNTEGNVVYSIYLLNRH